MEADGPALALVRCVRTVHTKQFKLRHPPSPSSSSRPPSQDGTRRAETDAYHDGNHDTQSKILSAAAGGEGEAEGKEIETASLVRPWPSRQRLARGAREKRRFSTVGKCLGRCGGTPGSWEMRPAREIVSPPRTRRAKLGHLASR